MPFIRLSDDYFDNPKFTRLSDGAFRLWHEALAHCRRHSTDGLFDFPTMRGWRSFTRGREKELTTPHREGANPLWVLIPATGYKLHDYLDWNLSREEEAAERIGAAERMRRHRSKKRKSDGVTNAVTAGVTNGVRSGDGEGDGERKIQIPEIKEIPIDARSKRPIFTGQRVTVFEWMLDDCVKTLGNYLEAFDLHEWFFALDQRVMRANLVIPKRDGGAWLQAELVAEAQKRGIPLAFARPAATEKKARASVGGSSCPHDPRCATNAACIQLVLEQDRATRAVSA